MFLSDVPDPEANMFLCVGFQAKALTAALCSPSLFSKHIFLKSQTMSWLSLPPEAM